MNEPLFWLFMTFLWTSLMSFFSAEEMACISYNKLKLEVQARLGKKRAQWIRELLHNPSIFFATTLIGVNFCLVISSESMRQLFSSLGWNPNLSPILHVPYVLFLGELIPMFAARLFPEHTATFGSPLLKVTSILVAPFAALSESLFRIALRPWVRKTEEQRISFFQQEELKELINGAHYQKREEEDPSSLLFQTLQQLKVQKTADYLMPLSSLPKLHEGRNASFALEKLRSMKKEIAFIFNRQKGIIGYVTEEDLLINPPLTILRSIAKCPIFVSETASASTTFSRMRQEKIWYGFAIDRKGAITGIISLFSFLEYFIPQPSFLTASASLHISKTIPANMTIVSFCKKYGLPCRHSDTETFLDVMERTLDHKPKLGETVSIDSLSVTVKEATLLGPKTLFVDSR